MPQRPGTLLSMRLQNFGPHVDVTFSFPSALNIIVAPNGSGKSMVVNAISLVFGGATKSLNRATTYDQFIKDGESEASVTAEIVDSNGGSMKIRRTIKRGRTAPQPAGARKRAVPDDERHTSDTKFFINDRPVHKEDVQTLVERLGIQVDNLCQFLPQDRVDDFTKMSTNELLKNTELSVGGRELLEQHEELKTRTSDLAQDHNAVEDKVKELALLKDQNKPLEAQVSADEHRRQLETRLENMRDVQLAQNFQLKKAIAQEAKRAAETAAANLAVVEATLRPLEQRLEQHSRSLAHLSDQEFQHLKKVVSEKLKADSAAQLQLESTFENARTARQKIREAIDTLKRTREQIPQLIADLEEKKQRLVERRPLAEDEREVEQLKADIRNAEEVRFRCEQAAKATQQELTQYEQQAATLRNRLMQLQSIQQRRLDALRNSDPHTYNAAMWARENAAKFESEVFGPIQTLINPSSKLAARILEALIPGRDMRAFICQATNDQRNLAALSRPPNNWKINVNYAGAIPDRITPLDIEPLRRFGVDAVLSNLFDCQPVLKNYLCQQFNLHLVPVCTKSGVKVNTQGIFDANPRIRVIATEEFLYQAQVMRYGGGSRMFNDVGLSGNVRFLGESIDPSLVAECQAEIARVAQKLETAKANHQETAAKVDVEAQKIGKIKERGKVVFNQVVETRRLLRDVESAKAALNKLRGETLDFDKLAADAQRDLDNTISRQMKLAEEKEKAVRAANDAICRGCELAVEIRVLERLVEQSDGQVAELRVQRQTRFNEKRQADNEAQQARETAAELRARATEAMQRLAAASINVQEFTDPEAVTREISELTNQIDALQAPMDRRQRQLYEERCQRIAKLEDDVKNGRLKADTSRNRLEKDGNNWRNRIQEIAQGLSQHFSDSMQSFGTGCSGEVAFTSPDDLSDYKSYGLELRVAFRATMPRRAVSSEYQSGGERAVTALNYILALHHYTQSPFVVVDELNQGMDPMNERRSYQFLARTTLIPGAPSSQFIWITPKATHVNDDVFSTPGVAMISIGRCLASVQLQGQQQQKKIQNQVNGNVEENDENVNQDADDE